MVGRRSPGQIPKLSFPPLAEEIYALNRFLKRIGEVTLGLPTPHADTHMGGDDDISGGQLPSTITLGSDGAIGDGDLGFAPINHDHPNDFGGLADFADLEMDEQNGAPVEDKSVRRLLEEILLVATDIADLLEAQR